MAKEKSWWGEGDDEEEVQSVKEVNTRGAALIPLDAINRKAERGAVLGSVAALISIRALKACQIQETRIAALEKTEKTEKTEDKPSLPEVVKVGRFEMKTAELLDLPEATLERILDAAQETLEDPDFGAEVEELLQREELPQLVAVEAGNDDEA